MIRHLLGHWPLATGVAGALFLVAAYLLACEAYLYLTARTP